MRFRSCDLFYVFLIRYIQYDTTNVNKMEIISNYFPFIFPISLHYIMKHVGQEIDSIIRKRKIKKTDFSQSLGISTVTFSKLLQKPSIDAKLLEIISEKLCIPVGYFFNEDIEVKTDIGHKISGSGNNIGGGITFGSSSLELEQLRLENTFLKKELADKEQIIKEKERLISVLMKKE